jgi:alpha-L-rhamnosidase
MKNVILFLSAFLLFLSCTNQQINFDEYKNLNNANWISDNAILPDTDSLFYTDQPSPIFRKEFKTNSNLVSATLLITAAGYYKAIVNGERIGKNILDPAWTDFSKRIYYSEYDITSHIQSGKNCLGVTLGNGFYNPLPLKMWGRRNLREVLPIGNPSFIAKLLLKYEDGKVDEIISDGSWKYLYGPIVRNNVYLGEVYNAVNEIPNWDLPDFNDDLWENAIVVDGPGGELHKAFFPPVQVTQKIPAVKISALKSGIYIVDMGINFTGLYNIKLTGQKGDTITFRFGERVYDDGSLNPMTTVCGQIKREGLGGVGAPAIAWQTDSYIFNDKQEIWYRPEFTFHTYRFIEISGLKNEPQLSDIEGLVLNSAVNQTNSFTCSSTLLNSIQEATQRTFLANLISVQSDCAAREKFGYGGDLNATSESFIYNFDMLDFYRKTIYDWVDVMNDSVFVDTAPYVGIKYCGISWESAFLTTQYYLYLYYGDKDIVKEMYNLNRNWMDKVARIHPDGIVKEGLSDHESLEPVPVELTGTCHYLQCARIMEDFAKIMDDKVGEEKFRKLSNELQEKIKIKFWDQPVKDKLNKQTLFSTLLYHNIVPDEEIVIAKDSLLAALRMGPSQHFNTGIFGTKYILESLSKLGFSNSVFNVVNSTNYPGWGHMIDRGATTIWETWKESDNTYSNCHPMFGSVTEWFYRWLAGIQPNTEFPGFERFVLSPFIPHDLDFVKCNYLSPNGEIVSNWKKEGANKITFDFTIPDNSIATFRLPKFEIQNISIVQNATEKSYKPNDSAITDGWIELKSGEYRISITYKQLKSLM